MSSTALFNELSSYFNMDPDDPSFQKDLMRPAEIKEDFKLMEQRQRVTKIMKSKLFKRELENIVKTHGLNDDYDGPPTSTLSLAEISEQLLLAAIPKNKVQNFAQLSNRKGIICINDLHIEAISMYGRIECQFRCRLAATFRLIDMYGWNGGLNTSMSARPFKDREQFIINPFGLMFNEISASSFLSIDFKGNILDFGSTVLEAHNSAWMIHASLYSFRPDIRAILHIKTPAAVTISSMEQGLLPISRQAIVLGNVIKLSELPSLEQAAKSTSLILADIKNYLTSVLDKSAKVLIIPNQGFLVCGDNVEEAWHLLTNCQMACETQLKLGNLDMEDIMIPEKSMQIDIFNGWRNSDMGGVMESQVEDKDGQKVPIKWRLGELEFEALMRHLDNNGYRTGYLYRQENLYSTEMETKYNKKHDTTVQIPASSTGSWAHHVVTDDNLDDSRMHSILKSKSDRWFNTPNSYKLADKPDDVDDEGILITSQKSATQQSTQDRETSASMGTDKIKSTNTNSKWVSAKSTSGPKPSRPQHPVTAGAYVSFDGGDKNAKYNRAASVDYPVQRISVKEIIENQRRVRSKYYHDTNTAGPISCLLDSGLSREEAMRMKSESLRKQMNQPGDMDGEIITSASKGIIQRGHKAIVYQELYRPANPFDNITAEDLEQYKNEVDRKMHPQKYASVDDGLQALEDDREAHEEMRTDDRITSLQSEPEMGTQRVDSLIGAGLTSDSDALNDNFTLPTFAECSHFFKSGFDVECCNETSNEMNTSKVSLVLKEATVKGKSVKVVAESGDLNRSISTLETKSRFKGLRALSFRMLSRSKSVKESADVLESSKAATLAAPPHTGAMTSETSGADVSHDEVDQDGKSKKKKRRFKFPFSKKKKDKSK